MPAPEPNYPSAEPLTHMAGVPAVKHGDELERSQAEALAHVDLIGHGGDARVRCTRGTQEHTGSGMWL